jgi:hypothetical protein
MRRQAACVRIDRHAFHTHAGDADTILSYRHRAVPTPGGHHPNHQFYSYCFVGQVVVKIFTAARCSRFRYQLVCPPCAVQSAYTYWQRR